MNSIRQIQALNKRELEEGVSPEASWHADYRDTAYIYIGGLPFDLSEGDIITIFSQFGEPTFVDLIRDKETGKSKGFAFLKYEDQRSTDLAVDNLGGAVIMGRTLRVDHTRYKKKDTELEGQANRSAIDIDAGDEEQDERLDNRKSLQTLERPLLKEELELEAIIKDYDDDDPMKPFLIEEKKEEIALKLAQQTDNDRPRDRRRHHRHHHSHHRDHSRERHKSARRSSEKHSRPHNDTDMRLQ